MTLIRLNRIALTAAIGLALFALQARDAAAAVGFIAYDLSIGESARYLDAIGTALEDEVFHSESCDNPHNRIKMRNRPGLMLTNRDTSDSPITSFTLNIENLGTYVWGQGDFVSDVFTNYVKNTTYTDPGVSITGSSVSNGGKSVTIDFSGLTAGKRAIFCLDIDDTNLNNFPFPDYRSVLLGAPMFTNAPETPVATFTVKFTDPNNATMTGTLAGQFEDINTVPSYAETNVRPYTSMDGVEQHSTGGEIPEPAGLALAGIAIGAASLARRRKTA